MRNVTGQPLRRGILVDAIYDIGRIENVHFNPWWSNRGAFTIGRLKMARLSSSAAPIGNMC